MRLFQLLFFLMFTLPLSAQNPDGFEGMCNENIAGTVPLATPTQLKFEASKNASIVILDARELNEYEISHIENAIYIGYNNFDFGTMQKIDKNSKIYVYCSIGYRSEKIGEKLIAAGYKNVYNLKGGIFSWVNNGNPVYDKKENPTTKVHGFNKDWAKWINEDKCNPVLK